GRVVGLAYVGGGRVKSAADHVTVLGLERAPGCGLPRPRHGDLALGIAGLPLLDARQRRGGLARSANQRRHVLGKARAAITWPRMEKLVADAAIGADRGGDFLDVGADRLAQVGNLVDETDLHGEEGLSGIFGW